MTIKEFTELIEDYQKNRKEIDKICSVFPNFYELKPVDYGNIIFDKLIEAYFKEEGADWIFWWLYTKDGNPEMKAYDENKKEIPTETVEDLWNIVKEYLK